MSRLGSFWITVVALSLILMCLGCGGSGISTATTPVVTPGIVTLTPANDVSLKSAILFRSPQSPKIPQGTALDTFSPHYVCFQQSQRCSGCVQRAGLCRQMGLTYQPSDLHSRPGRQCRCNATFQRGVTSAPATVHVHQHIDSIAISPVATPTPTPACVSNGRHSTIRCPLLIRGSILLPLSGPSTGIPSTQQ